MRYIFFFLSFFCFSVWAQNSTNLRHYGNEKAPVQMYLFSSMTCPHCAKFHNNILPQIQKNYLNNQKAFLSKVEVIGDEKSLMATTFVRCQNQETADKIEQILYDEQRNWRHAENLSDQLSEYTKNISHTDIKKCLSNKSFQEKIFNQQNNLSQNYQIKRLPTLIVRYGSKTLRLEGSDEKNVLQSLENLFKEVKPSK